MASSRESVPHTHLCPTQLVRSREREDLAVSSDGEPRGRRPGARAVGWNSSGPHPLTQTVRLRQTRDRQAGRKGKEGGREAAPAEPHSPHHTRTSTKTGGALIGLRVQKLGFLWACVVLCREVKRNDWCVISAVSGIHLCSGGRWEGRGVVSAESSGDGHW